MDTKEIIGVEEKNNLGPTKSPAQNGVIITVYVESPRRQSPLRTAALEKSKAKSVPKKLQTARKRGHDRRAQLLAYARELRNGPNGGTSREVQCPRNNSTAKPKVFSSNPISKNARKRAHAWIFPNCKILNLNRKHGNGWCHRRVYAFGRVGRSNAQVADGDTSAYQ